MSLRAFDSGAERFDLAFGELDRFNTFEANLHASILSARTGLLRNYDPLECDTDTLNALVRRMQASLAGDLATETAIERLKASVRRQEGVTEKFKSNNALLQNSLAYFALSSAQLGVPDQADPLAPEVSARAAAMLDLTLDTDPATLDEVRNRLNALELGWPDSAFALIRQRRYPTFDDIVHVHVHDIARLPGCSERCPGRHRPYRLGARDQPDDRWGQDVARF